MGITFTNKKSTKDSDGGFVDAGVDSDAEKKLATGTGGKARNDLLPKFSLEKKLVSTLVTALNPVRKPSKGQIAKVVRSIRALPRPGRTYPVEDWMDSLGSTRS